MRKGRGGGFTLIELLVVIAILAVIAAITLPNLLSARMFSNETSAVATLRSLFTAQTQMGISSKIDLDDDGKGEFGTFLELSGAVGVRQGKAAGAVPGSDFSSKGSPVSPAHLPGSFSSVDERGFATKAGYAFMIFLPDSGVPAAFVHETGPAGKAGLDGGTKKVGVDASENCWCAYGQPMLCGATGNRRFFVNQRGDLLQASNEPFRRQGVLTPIVGDSAFTGSGITAAVAIGTKGQDGDFWKVSN